MSQALVGGGGGMAEYFTTAGYFYKTSTSAIEFVSRQPITVVSFRSFALACQCMEMLKRGGITSIPTSIAPRLCCVCLPFNPCQCASHYKLYSRPPCVVLNLCFWFRPGISHSLGFERVTDVSPARASRCSSACHQLKKALVRIMYPRCTLLQVSAMRCVPAAQRETAILKRNLF